MPPKPTTLGALRKDVEAGRLARRSVKSEIRDNLIRKLRAGETLFPGIIGYDDTVVPQVINAVLSRHNFILLGLRGQAKTRILRALTSLLDEWLPVVPGCEIHDDPLAPICAACRGRVRADGDALPVAWLGRDARYVEKLATPDVTIADMIGDLDPIKAARASLELSDELTMHYGLVPRANRGIFAINELPDLAGKIQVGLFNILQEGDVQIKGYPVRLPLDLQVVFSANPEDYTARGKIITPLKDRIGSEIRTHYPASRQHAMQITRQEAWIERSDGGDIALSVPDYVREMVEEVAFQARQDQKIDKRSGVSQRLPISLLENVISNAERRALATRRAGRGPARHRRLRGDSRHHRKVRARIRRGAEGGRQRRARTDPRRGLGRLRRLVPERRHAAGDRMVRSRRQAADRRHACRRRSCSSARVRSRACTRPRAAAASARSRRTRSWRRRWTSCSKGCTPSARSAARPRDSSRRPNRSSSASRAKSIR